MEGKLLSEKELQEIQPGEAVTVAAVMAIMVIAVMAVVVYKLMRSSNGNVKVPGGWQFSWK